MKFPILGAVAAMALATSAAANVGGKNHDADGDGQVSRAEHDAGVEATWKSLDKNGDGQLSGAELGDKAAKLADADTNGDGQISADEFKAKKSAWFAKADANGDGMLSASEMAAAKTDKKR